MRYVGGNRLSLLRNGDQYFPALVAAIDAAREEIRLETYIYAGDETGSLITDALARAAARGVRAYVLIDGFGSLEFPERFRAILAGAGVRLHVFRPVRLLNLRRDRLRRMHRKLACIDGRVAFIGGINVVDDFDTPSPTPPRFDYAVRVEGPLTAEVRAAAARLWARVTRETAPPAALPDAARMPVSGGHRAALVVRDSLRHRRDIEHAYLAHLRAARREVIIANAYFLPGRRFRRALVEAARRGVRVTLLLQGRVEYLLLHLASRAMYGQLLDAGIGIHEYQRSILHAKVAVFDGEKACVGSSNIDPFSLLMALEANLFIDDARFAQELRASLHDALRAGALAIPPQQWRARPLWQRIPIWIALGISRLLVAFAGYERYH
ncbi:MAG TPA: cardiolipin synthase ClsB [Burkholderiales bacterium]|nr:cardiolipin synthase ClsB [Burkholderiales bacterium]